MADNQHASGSALPLTGFIPFPPGQTTRYGNADSPPPSVDVQPPTPGLPAGDSGDAFVRDHYEGASTDGMFGRFEYQLGEFALRSEVDATQNALASVKHELMEALVKLKKLEARTGAPVPGPSGWSPSDTVTSHATPYQNYRILSPPAPTGASGAPAGPPGHHREGNANQDAFMDTLARARARRSLAAPDPAPAAGAGPSVGGAQSNANTLPLTMSPIQGYSIFNPPTPMLSGGVLPSPRSMQVQDGPIPSVLSVTEPYTWSQNYPYAAPEMFMPGTPWHPYTSAPAAAGIGGRTVHFKPEETWTPRWSFFELKAYRGAKHTSIIVKPSWDDERLLRELRRAYNKLRSWRRVLSLKTFSSMVLVWADVNYVYPQMHFTAVTSSASAIYKSLRIRYYFRHPQALRGKSEFMQYLTMDSKHGVMFLERWDPVRIAFAILVPIMSSLVVAVLWSHFSGSVQDGFTIGSYMVGAYSACLVLVGILNWVQF